MARPASRRQRREEEEDPPARGRRGSAPKPGGPNTAMIALGGAVLVLAGGIAFLLTDGGKKPKVEEKPVLAPKAAPLGPATPAKAPPPPLTAEERTYIDGLFTRAQPHAEAAARFAREGWEHKGGDDMEAANESWKQAKHELQEAIGIVSEALEDYDRFPQERQDLHMRNYNSRLSGWTKEYSNIPKVDADR